MKCSLPAVPGSVLLCENEATDTVEITYGERVFISPICAYHARRANILFGKEELTRLAMQRKLTGEWKDV